MEMENSQQEVNQEGNLNQDTPPSNPISNQKGNSLLIIGVIVLVLVIGAGGYFLYQKQVNKQAATQVSYPTPSPTSDETANWKTYSNSSLGFSFSYPMILGHLYDQFGFNHPDNPEGNLLLQNYDGSKPRQDQSTDFQMVVEANKNSDQITLDKYVKDPNKVWNQSVQTFTNITLGNEPALKGLAIQKNEKVPAIWVSHKGYILTIYLETPKSTNASLFDQILATFKFTNQGQTNETASWKTETVQIKKETTVSGSENISLAIQSPSGWTLKTMSKTSDPNDLIKNCVDYVLTNADSTAKLTISPVCSGWAAEYSDWPQSAVIIKEEKNVGNDGHTAYTVRYLDSVTNQYKYVEGEKGASNKIMDAILIRYNASTGNFLPTRIMLNYSGVNKESIVEISDKIVTTLSAK